MESKQKRTVWSFLSSLWYGVGGVLGNRRKRNQRLNKTGDFQTVIRVLKNNANRIEMAQWMVLV